MNMPVLASQSALDAFVVSQLVDNGMDTVGRKINALYAKLQHTQGDAALQKRYARKLQHHLAIACRLLAQHEHEIDTCIDMIERDIQRGVLQGPKSATSSTVSSIASNGNGHSAPSLETGLLAVGRHVAAKVARSHELWILARVVSYSEINRVYEVEDVDTGEDEAAERASTPSPRTAQVLSRRHHLVPRDQVKGLPGDTLAATGWIHYELNQHVMAVYPGTTSFYRGVVRVPNPKGAPYVLVRFDDDADEFGTQAPDRKIPFRFVIPL